MPSLRSKATQRRRNVQGSGHGEWALSAAWRQKHRAAHPEGLERSRRARLVHGYYTAEAKAARAEARRTMRTLQLLLREAKSE
jgi:hypothetical protein